MEKTYKRFLVIILIPVIIAAFPFLVFATASDTAAYDWYFKPTEDGSRPELCPEADFLSDFDVITVDKSDEKVLYLTFDAGYDNGYHKMILDTLSQKDVPAAFFVDGNFVKSNPDIVRRMQNEGHIVGNHSKSHPDMTTLHDFSEYSKQISEWEDAVKALGLTPSKYFRFPMGRFSERALEYNKRLGVTSVFWSFAYFDWDNDKQPTHAEALDKIYSRVHDGAVLLLHSTSRTNAEILSQVIDKLKSDGYSFKSLDDYSPL